MIYFKNPFNLPGPKDLGMSDSNYAMPSDLFLFPNENDDRPTWEMYYARLKREYPVKFFLSSTLPGALLYAWRRAIGWKLRDAWYWLQSFVWRKDHLLDLRQPGTDQLEADYYRWGWLDTDHKMLFALFNLLDEFMDGGLPIYFPSSEEAAKDDGSEDNYQYAGLKRQRELCLEVIAIHDWWKHERKREHKLESELCSKWSDAHKARAPETESLWQELRVQTEKNEQQEEEMIARLMKIRRSLWS